MNMIPVKSSHLKAVAYNPETCKLVIRFKNSLYEYSGVPDFVYEELLSAESIDRYHHYSIQYSYPSKQIE
ncbi:KTSC domain-containing protein [Halobacillus sp. A5]|uniref:KTSC domain-containing protein n=1 Tax=Halobacillus sp. A5 TaxID=2880263 RepID=UPI0020A6C784|nr:KTSC domain-containing protein [Halobacillus sp. A5]MCP3027740.1 KTSC domain-containing protein [Halobacillus sp. A5]